MPPRKRKGNLGIKTGAKALEKKLVSKANALAKDYTPLLPTGCERYFAKEERVLAKIQRFVEDEKALSKLSKKGDSLGKAYAGTLLLTVSETTPTFAVLRLPHGEVSIAFWGQTSKDKLIGVQYYDDPVFRLYSIKDLAQKRKIYVYSVENSMVCTGREPSPPKGFVGMVLKAEDVAVVRKEGQYLCHHLDKEWGPNLHVKFISTGEGVRLCPRCLKDDRNTSGMFVSRMVGKNVEGDLEARVDLGIVWDGEEKGGTYTLNTKYLKGQISDQKAFNDAEAMAKEDLISKKVIVVGGRGYDNVDEMVDALEGTDDEKRALLAALDGLEHGVIVSETIANSVLTDIWEERGLVALSSVIKDEGLAKRLYEERSLADTGPGQIIAEAVSSEKKKKLLSRLPEYKRLGPVTKIADDLARIYRMEGNRGVLFHLRNSKPNDTRVKSTAYAFLLAIGEGGAEWKYTGHEREFAEYLKEFTSRLLNCKDSEYNDALEALCQASGSGEKVV